jgi:hypothetical protein
MLTEWIELMRLTNGAPIAVERVRLVDNQIAVEGNFALPPLAQLSGDDQVFVSAFVGCHGSIKDMERLFGISYPTVKNRLEKLAGKLKMVELVAPSLPETQDDVLAQLEKGNISVDEALRRLEK